MSAPSFVDKKQHDNNLHLINNIREVNFGVPSAVVSHSFLKLQLGNLQSVAWLHISTLVKHFNITLHTVAEECLTYRRKGLPLLDSHHLVDAYYHISSGSDTCVIVVVGYAGLHLWLNFYGRLFLYRWLILNCCLALDYSLFIDCSCLAVGILSWLDNTSVSNSLLRERLFSFLYLLLKFLDSLISGLYSNVKRI